MEFYSLEKYPLVVSNSLLLKMTIEIVDLPIENREMTILFAGWWFQTFFIFHNIWDVILPIDELRFFKMVIAPPTSFVVNSFGVTALLRCTGCTRRGMLAKASSPQISTSPLNCGMRQWGCEKWRVMLGEWMQNHGLLTIVWISGDPRKQIC